MLTFGHTVKPKDQKRITCQYGGLATGKDSCTKPATVCLYLEWSSQPGCSFFYHCDEHTKELLTRG